MTTIHHNVVDTTVQTVESSAANDLRHLGGQLHELLQDSDSVQAATEKLCDLVRRLTRSRAILYFGRDCDEQLTVLPDYQWPEKIADETIHQCFSLAGTAVQTGAVQIVRATENCQSLAIATPVWRAEHPSEVMLLIIEMDAESSETLAGVVLLLQFVAAYTAQWRGRFSELRQALESNRFEKVWEAILTAEVPGQFTASINRLADGMRQATDSSLVALGLCRAGGVVRLAGLSHELDYDRGAEFSKCLEEVMSEALIGDEDQNRKISLHEYRQTDSVQQLMSRMGSCQVRRAPLRDATGNIIGAYVLTAKSFSRGADERLQVAEGLVGTQLDLVRRGRRRPWQFGAQWFGAQWYRELHLKQKQLVWGFAILAACVLFLWPWPHRLSSKCEIQPTIRRFVASPYEGRLETVLVEPGDWVDEGQVLARMDAREIRLQRASVEADLGRAVKQRDTALASRDTAAAQMALYEMERLRLNLQLLQDRMDHLEIKSPTQGVVISGNLQEFEGSRLSLGQSLMEVGSLGKEMNLEVAIRDEDVAYAEVGQRVQFRLESLPYTEFSGIVTRIHPRAEQRGADNVFLAEVQINVNVQRLRPGMRGQAKIYASSRSLFWLVFHRAWESVLFRLGL